MRVDAKSQRKAELHCHIDGLLDPAMLDELARGGDPLAIDPAALAAHHPVRSVEQWLHGYGSLVDPATHPRDRWLPRMLELHLARLRAQHVVYTEILVSSLLFVRSDEAALVDLFAELSARARAAAGPALRVELVICIGRGPPEKLARQVPRITALRRAGLIRGVALAGLEAEYPVRPLRPFLDAFRDLGLGIEIHAGELAGVDSVKDALRHGDPDRLGHAIAAFSDEAVVAEIAERGDSHRVLSVEQPRARRGSPDRRPPDRPCPRAGAVVQHQHRRSGAVRMLDDLGVRAGGRHVRIRRV